MAEWDASTVSAVVALVVSFFALIIAFAQAIQQYFITGQLIRLCDSVVYGPLPGQGRRVYHISQFRFRVLYFIPQISLETHLWPGDWATDFVGKYPLPDLHRLDEGPGGYPDQGQTVDRPQSWYKGWWRKTKKNTYPLEEAGDLLSTPDQSSVGEASWVSFCRAVEPTCGLTMRMDLKEYDADRCPADLVTVPMPVSMRDVVAMALMAGMRVITYDFHTQSVFMQGDIGSITPASHPILGPILHFTTGSSNVQRRKLFGIDVYPFRTRGAITDRWIVRTWGTCTVAFSMYNDERRRRLRHLDERWNGKTLGGGQKHEVAFWDDNKRKKKARENKTKTSRPKEATREDSRNATDRGMPMRQGRDGDWSYTVPIAEVVSPPTDENASKKPKAGKTPGTSRKAAGRRSKNQATVEDAIDGNDEATVEPNEEETSGEDSEDRRDSRTEPLPLPYLIIASPADEYQKQREELAMAKQAERAQKMREIQRDKEIYQNAVNKGTKLPLGETRLLLTNYAHNSRDNQGSSGAEPQTKEEEEEEDEAEARERKRREERQQREDERQERLDAGDQAHRLRQVDMFWFCQMDIFRGTWATCWEAKVPYSCLVGAVTVVLECLLGFLPTTTGRCILYTSDDRAAWKSYRSTSKWLLSGHGTYPAYAFNARGGVIAEGCYDRVRIPAFGKEIIPALMLLYDYDWQVSDHPRDMKGWNEELNVELMYLDSWLSWVGRLDAITKGPNQLLKRTPSLVQLLIDEFDVDFTYIDASIMDGGLQNIQSLAASVMDWLMDEELTEAEQLYLLVAFLRAVKVGQCIASGLYTNNLYSLFRYDAQVHLV